MNSINLMSYCFMIFLLINNTNCRPQKDSKQQIQFYYRRVSNTNGYETYMDEFKITNYENRTVIAKDLYEFAKHYVDTVHTSMPVSSVDFVGQKPGEDLPENPAEDPFNTEKKKFLIGFAFDNFLEKNKGKSAIELHDLSVSTKKEVTFYQLRYPEDKVIADSILDSTQPFESNF